jgi:carbon monoxide dehydrogenase subunit G
VDVRESLEVPLPPEQALARCRAALERMRVNGLKVDPASATVRGRGRMTWASFGEQVECRVHPAGRGSRVEIRSRPTVPTTLVDYGKNRQNVEKVRAHLAQAG